MKPNTISLAKVYLVLFGLIHFYHVFSIIGIHETIVSAPSYLSFWWWHIILLLVYGVLPIISVLIGNEKSCLIVTGVSLVGLLMETFGTFTWITNFHFTFALLDSLAVILSLFLAVENVALEVAAEILSLEWSQF